MKSGQKDLIGPGDNDYGRKETKPIITGVWNGTETKPKKEIVKDLNPELTEKILKSFQKMAYDEMVSKKAVLHHLKQLKAEMGKIKKTIEKREHLYEDYLTKGIEEYQMGITDCMKVIDKKIAKINK